ncbi:MAG: (2Fe-2S)-binding protein [Methyloglobulus sp.]|nr:(2Fe-2S)-binding protein [Methyloglobulus sp.]
MYVCVCKAVTDTQIKNALDEGACSRRELFKCLGVGKDCGKCNPHVRELLHDHKQTLVQNSTIPSILAA